MKLGSQLFPGIDSETPVFKSPVRTHHFEGSVPFFFNFDSNAGYFTNPDSFNVILMSLKHLIITQILCSERLFLFKEMMFPATQFWYFRFRPGRPLAPYKGAALDPRPIFLFFQDFAFSSLCFEQLVPGDFFFKKVIFMRVIAFREKHYVGKVLHAKPKWETTKFTNRHCTKKTYG